MKLHEACLMSVLLGAASCGGDGVAIGGTGNPDATVLDGPASDAVRQDGPAAHAGARDSGVSDGATPDSDDGSVPDGGPPDVIVADSGGGPCMEGGVCQLGLTCCDPACVNEQNDPLNCGTCGHRCDGATSMCELGNCVLPTCAPPCTSNQSCCDVKGPGPSMPPACVDGPTCPVGCPLCQ